MLDRYDIVIVGGGPAGSAAALQLRALPAAAAARICLIDGEHFPRPKLCGGGLTSRTEELLACLDVRIAVPSVGITDIDFLFPGHKSTQSGHRLFRVVRRDEFDAQLLEAAGERGTELILGTGVVDIAREENAVCLRFADGRSTAATIVIGADGANSIVRRKLVPANVRVAPFVALEVLTPGHDVGASQRATFDFRPIERGVRGYAWDFPSLIDGAPFMNRGIAAIGHGNGSFLRDIFRDVLRERGIELVDHRLEGAWAPLYVPERLQSAPGVLLAGDALGLDPWLGEGISSAIGTGILAAHTAARSLQSGDCKFADYREAVLASAIGETFRQNIRIAQAFYDRDMAGRQARQAEVS